MWNDKSLSNLLFFPKLFLCHWQITPLSFWKHPFVIVETFKVKVYLVVSRHYPAQPFHLVLWCSYLLGSFLVACICAWRHFLGVRLYSNSNIVCQNFERELCLIMPSRLVESVSFAILHCQSYLQECISRGGLLHYSREQYLSWGSTACHRPWPYGGKHSSLKAAIR